MGYKKKQLSRNEQSPKDEHHLLLQVMAATLGTFNFNDMSRIYDAFNWRITAIESDIA